MSAGPEVLEFRRNHAPVPGTYRPTVSTPSPFQSPTTGAALGGLIPCRVNVPLPEPAELEFRRKKTPVVWLYTPTVSTPSPFQSPTIGRVSPPPSPMLKTMGGPPAFRRKNVPVAWTYRPTVS